MEQQIIDSMGNPLQVGNIVRYNGTGTTGTITEIIEDEEGVWAVIDKTNLLYSVKTLTITGVMKKEKELKEIHLSRDEIEQVLEKQKEQAPERIDDVSLESGG